MDTFILIFELVGTVAFAASGAMTGIKKNMDIFGVCILALTTAVGGGVIRDLILGSTPPPPSETPSTPRCPSSPPWCCSCPGCGGC